MTSDESPTMRKSAVAISQMSPPPRKTTQSRPSMAPAVVATPFPPRNPR